MKLTTAGFKNLKHHNTLSIFWYVYTTKNNKGSHIDDWNFNIALFLKI